MKYKKIIPGYVFCYDTDFSDKDINFANWIEMTSIENRAKLTHRYYAKKDDITGECYTFKRADYNKNNEIVSSCVYFDGFYHYYNYCDDGDYEREML